jgi:peroxiredoxin
MRHFQRVFVMVLLLWTGPVDAQPWVTEKLQEFDAERITDIVETGIYEAIGNEASPLTLWPLDGTGPETLQKYAGKIVVLQFWTTDCPPCIAQMTDLSNLQMAFADRGVRMIYVSPERPETLQRFLAEREIEGHYRRADKQELSPPYQVIAKPTTFVIGPEGEIQDGWLGAEDPETLQELIASH